MSETTEILKKIKEQKPLVHHITNWVTIYDCANIVRAIGALPVMAHAKEESGDMAKIAGALVLNIGTLTPELIESMKIAGKSANEKGIPVVLDAVGVGATKLRDDKAFELLNELKIDIIKGNASEIAKLAGEQVQTKGVEATKVEADLIEVGTKLANEKSATVVITGAEDIITNGTDVYLCKNGHDMMGSIVGTGCMVASVIGAFAGVEKDYAKAASAALVTFGIAGELASRNSSGPGSYKEHFYDEIYNLDEMDINDMERLEKKTVKKEEHKKEEEKIEEEPKEEIKKVPKKKRSKKKQKPKVEEEKVEVLEVEKAEEKLEEEAEDKKDESKATEVEKPEGMPKEEPAAEEKIEEAPEEKQVEEISKEEVEEKKEESIEEVLEEKKPEEMSEVPKSETEETPKVEEDEAK
jgi:hydroxyethylthiazole kinase